MSSELGYHDERWSGFDEIGSGGVGGGDEASGAFGVVRASGGVGRGGLRGHHLRPQPPAAKIGRASCRERV